MPAFIIAEGEWALTNYFYALAAIISAIWFAVHVFIGGREIAQPLRQSIELDPLVRDVQYLCWHFTTVSIAAISLFFVLAFFLEQQPYAVAGTIMAAGFTLTGIGLVAAIRQSHRKAPQGWLFAPITLLGLWGLLMGG